MEKIKYVSVAVFEDYDFDKVASKDPVDVVSLPARYVGDFVSVLLSTKSVNYLELRVPKED